MPDFETPDARFETPDFETPDFPFTAKTPNIMACCNQKRAALFQPESASAKNELPAPVLPAEVFFQYTGTKSLTAFGAVTGKTYRFDMPGASLAIDRRDAPGMMAVPMLERVREKSE